MPRSKKPDTRHKSGFRGPSPDVGKATQWQPGHSGNPEGRPKKLITLVSDAIREKLKEIGDPDAGKTYAELIADKLVTESIAGKFPISAISELVDRAEGKPYQAMRIDGLPDNGNAGARLEELLARAATRAQQTPDTR